MIFSYQILNNKNCDSCICKTGKGKSKKKMHCGGCDLLIRFKIYHIVFYSFLISNIYSNICLSLTMHSSIWNFEKRHSLEIFLDNTKKCSFVKEFLLIKLGFFWVLLQSCFCRHNRKSIDETRYAELRYICHCIVNLFID